MTTLDIFCLEGFRCAALNFPVLAPAFKMIQGIYGRVMAKPIKAFPKLGILTGTNKQ